MLYSTNYIQFSFRFQLFDILKLHQGHHLSSLDVIISKKLKYFVFLRYCENI